MDLCVPLRLFVIWVHLDKSWNSPVQKHGVIENADDIDHTIVAYPEDEEVARFLHHSRRIGDVTPTMLNMEDPDFSRRQLLPSDLFPAGVGGNLVHGRHQQRGITLSRLFSERLFTPNQDFVDLVLGYFR